MFLTANFSSVILTLNQPLLPEEGPLRISSDRDYQTIFLGLKFSIPGFFWVGICGKYFFGWLDLVGIFWVFKTI